MAPTPQIHIVAATVKARIALIARYEVDHDRKARLRRIRLNDDVTVYTLLYSISEHSLIDVSTNDVTLEELFDEHQSNSAVVQELSIANGTNVRLNPGESIICVGEDEYVAMKLTEDDIVTYRSAESSLLLLHEVSGLLATQLQIAEPYRRPHQSGTGSIVHGKELLEEF